MFSFLRPKAGRWTTPLPALAVLAAVLAILGAPGPSEAVPEPGGATAALENSREAPLRLASQAARRPSPQPSLQAGIRAATGAPPLQVRVEDGTSRGLAGALVRIRPFVPEIPKRHLNDPWRTLGWTTGGAFRVPWPGRAFELQLSAEGRTPQKRVVEEEHRGELRVELLPEPIEGSQRLLCRLLPEGEFLRQVRYRVAWVDPVTDLRGSTARTLARLADEDRLPWRVGPLLAPRADGLIDVELELMDKGSNLACRLEVYCDHDWPEGSVDPLPSRAQRLWASAAIRPVPGQVANLGLQRFGHILRLRAELDAGAAAPDGLEWLLLLPDPDSASPHLTPLAAVAGGLWPDGPVLDAGLDPGLSGEAARFLLLRDLAWSVGFAPTLHPGFNEVGSLPVPEGQALSGVVLGPTGRPVPDAAVRLLDWGPWARTLLPAEVEARTVVRTGIDGGFRFPRVQRGHYRVLLEEASGETYGQAPDWRLVAASVEDRAVDDLCLWTDRGIRRWSLELDLGQLGSAAVSADALRGGRVRFDFRFEASVVDFPAPELDWSEGGASLQVYPGSKGVALYRLQDDPELPWIRAGAFCEDDGEEEQVIVLRPYSAPYRIQGPPDAAGGMARLRSGSVRPGGDRESLLWLTKRRRETTDPALREELTELAMGLVRGTAGGPVVWTDVPLDSEGKRWLIGLEPGRYRIEYRTGDGRWLPQKEWTLIRPTPAFAAAYPTIPPGD